MKMKILTKEIVKKHTELDGRLIPVGCVCCKCSTRGMDVFVDPKRMSLIIACRKCEQVKIEMPITREK